MVRLELSSTPECGTYVRAMLAGIGGAQGWNGALIDDLKTAATEACNNVVIHAYDGKVGKLVVRLEADADWMALAVCDEGAGLHGVSVSDDHLRVGLPVISALADRVEFLSGPDGGTEVRMFFPTRSGGIQQAASGERQGAGGREHSDPPMADLIGGSTTQPVASLVGKQAPAIGDVAGVVSPVGLLGPALGRLVRALAGVSHFRLDRFSELRVLTDTLGAHARAAASESRVGFALGVGERRLEVAAGPFKPGTGAVFTGEGVGQPASPLRELVDELSIDQGERGEMVRLVISDLR